LCCLLYLLSFHLLKNLFSPIICTCYNFEATLLRINRIHVAVPVFGIWK
jgi:hypothetical protein